MKNNNENDIKKRIIYKIINFLLAYFSQFYVVFVVFR